MVTCTFCERPATEEHHLIFGKGKRPLADRDKVVKELEEMEQIKYNNYWGYLISKDRAIKIVKQQLKEQINE